MRVNRLSLRNFRNSTESSFNPGPRLNFLIGANGQGKTTFLEALSYLSALRSFRGAKNDELIRWGEAGAEISARLSDQGEPDGNENQPWQTDLKVAFHQDGSRTAKTAFINQKPYRSSTQYLSQRFGSFELGFHSIVFNPSDHDLIRGEPAIRRAYLDRVIAAEDLKYLKILQKYQRTLLQRNSLLRSDPKPSRTLLDGFTEPLVNAGSWLLFKRLEWVNRLNPNLQAILPEIAPKQPSLRLIYVSKWAAKITDFFMKNSDLNQPDLAGQPPPASLELIEQTFRSQLIATEAAELNAGSTLVGPHRDDWAFSLGEQRLKGHGSQGEVRSALLAFKLSEISLFRERTKHRPLLLLDDFSSELDRERRSYLLRFLKESDLQVFITTTEDFSGIGERFEIQEGRVLPAS